MYLISLYFDGETEQKIRNYEKQIAKHTGNDQMSSGNIPPHITLSAFHTYHEETALEIFHNTKENIYRGEIQLVSVGSFFPGVLFVQPVLNEYLYELSCTIYKEVEGREGVLPVDRYRPFSWIPHITIGKGLDGVPLQKAFEVMQKQFAPFKGEGVELGLAKTNPYTNLEKYVLK